MTPLSRDPAPRRKPNVYWMIRDPAGEFAYHCARYTRALCISDFVMDCQATHRDPPYTPTWDDLKREGYRCEKVEIRALRGKKP